MTDKEINTQRAMLDIKTPTDYGTMMKYLNIMCDRYKFMSISYIGESILGRCIPMVSLGEGKKQIVYIGAHSGKDWLGSAALIRFINEYCEVKKNGGRIYNYSIDYLFATRRICVIPMLNPDGVDININGVGDDNILKDRIMSMRQKRDFSDWEANARGVCLQNNYNGGFLERRAIAENKGIISGAPWGYGGEAPESEPEIGALCATMRFSEGLRAALCIGGDRDKIYYRTDKKAPPRGKSIGAALSRMNGCRLQDEKDGMEYGGFEDFCIEELNIPTFSIPCQVGNGKYPYSYFDVYSKHREVFFTLPALV